MVKMVSFKNGQKNSWPCHMVGIIIIIIIIPISQVRTPSLSDIKGLAYISTEFGFELQVFKRKACAVNFMLNDPVLVFTQQSSLQPHSQLYIINYHPVSLFFFYTLNSQWKEGAFHVEQENQWQCLINHKPLGDTCSQQHYQRCSGI